MAAGEVAVIARHAKPAAQLAPPGGAARFLDRAPLRAGVPPVRDDAGGFTAEAREDERY